MDKQETMKGFYAHYPQLVKYPLPDKQFSWLWYFAMQQMGDDDAQHHAREMKEKLWKRSSASNTIALFIPTLHTQLQLNTLTKSGLENHLQFLDNTERFHEKMRLYFYSKIFKEAPVKDENWSRFKEEYFVENVPIDWLQMYLPLLIVTVVLCVLSVFNYGRNLVA